MSGEPPLFSRPTRRGTTPTSPPGICTIFKTKLTWTPESRSDAAPALVELAAVTKTQQAPTKPFIRLEWPTGNLVLGFETIASRDEAVELIKQLRSGGVNGGGAPSSDAQDPDIPNATEKAAFFARDKDLERVYLDLVVPGIIPELDFWRSRRSQLARLDANGATSSNGHRSQQQSKGLPNAMASDVRPAADGQTDTVHFSLTPEIITQIFTERPEVHRAYLAKVPHELSEKEFWTAYFKEQYKRLARRRRGLGAAEDEFEDQMFGPFRQQVARQEALRAKARLKTVDPTLDLESERAEEYAILQRTTGDAPQAAGYLSHDLNRHGALVLEGTPLPPGALDAGESHDTLAIAKKLAELRTSGNKPSSGERSRQEHDAGLEDLRGKSKEDVVPLDIRDPAVYFRAAMQGADDESLSEMGIHSTSALSPVSILQGINPSDLPNPPCPPELAQRAMEELSTGSDAGLVARFGALAASVSGVPADVALLPGLLSLLRSEALRTQELLRHFWTVLLGNPGANAEKRAGELARALHEQAARLDAHMAAVPASLEQVYASILLGPWKEAIDLAMVHHKRRASEWATNKFG